MSKSKSKSSKAAPVPNTSALSKVKDAAVTKPAQTPKAKSKEIAKQVASKAEKKSKHKKVKEPTPEPESDSAESASSGDVSDSDSEAKVPVKKNGVANGHAKVKGKAALQDSASSGSDSDDEPAANGTLGSAPTVAKAAQDSSDDEDSDDSDVVTAPAPVNGASKAAAASSGESASSDSDDDSDDEKPSTIKKSAGVDKATKSTGLQGSKKTSDDEPEEDDDDDDDEDSDDSSDSDDELAKEDVEPKRAASKRKAEEEAAPAGKKAKTGGDAGDSQGKNLFVGSLSWGVDEEWLTREFEEFGELTGVRIITDRTTGRSKGFGYVEYANAADAAKAHAAKQGAELDGRAINIDFATARTSGDQKDKFQSRAKTYGDSTSDPTDTLWVGNISFQVDQDQLSTAFQDYGTIMGVRLPTDRETGAPKGFGYVTYSSVDEAKVAFEAMQGADLAGRSLRLDYSQPRPNNGDSPARGGRGGGRGGFGDRGRGGFGGGRGGGRGGFGDRGRGGFGGGRGGSRGGRGGSTNRGGFGDFSGKKTTF